MKYIKMFESVDDDFPFLTKFQEIKDTLQDFEDENNATIKYYWGVLLKDNDSWTTGDDLFEPNYKRDILKKHLANGKLTAIITIEYDGCKVEEIRNSTVMNIKYFSFVEFLKRLDKDWDIFLDMNNASEKRTIRFILK